MYLKTVMKLVSLSSTSFSVIPFADFLSRLSQYFASCVEKRQEGERDGQWPATGSNDTCVCFCTCTHKFRSFADGFRLSEVYDRCQSLRMVEVLVWIIIGEICHFLLTIPYRGHSWSADLHSGLCWWAEQIYCGPPELTLRTGLASAHIRLEEQWDFLFFFHHADDAVLLTFSWERLLVPLMPSLWMWTCSSWIMWGNPLETALSRVYMFAMSVWNNNWSNVITDILKKEANKNSALTFPLFLPDYVLALSVQELEMIGHHPLLAFMNDFGIGAGV